MPQAEVLACIARVLVVIRNMNKIQKELMYKSGIYLITNILNGKRYIGSSKNIYNRLHEHIHNLKRNKSHNAHLQSA